MFGSSVMDSAMLNEPVGVSPGFLPEPNGEFIESAKEIAERQKTVETLRQAMSTRSQLTPAQVERAKACGMGRKRPLVHEIESAIRFAKRHKLFTEDAIFENRDKRHLVLIVKANLSDFVAQCAAKRWWNEGD
jgi:hypothetical protein